MIPIRDINPTHKRPFVNVGLIALNVVVFLYEVSLGARVETLFLHYGVVPADVMLAFSGYQYADAVPPFFTSMFLHGGWLHLAGNMLYLWIFGDNIEDKLGHGRYFAFYMVCGLVAGALHVFIDSTSAIPTVGASGAISGVLGAYLLMFPKARVVTVIPIFFFIQLAELPALVVLGFWFVIQFFSGVISLGNETAGMGGVAWWAHIGGFLAGVVLVIPFRKRLP
ncbi:MAG: rhomboid family intramembrane serine protease [Bacteroidota bacterium]